MSDETPDDGNDPAKNPSTRQMPATQAESGLFQWMERRLQSLRAFHNAFQILLTLAILTALLIAYLWIFGLPSSLTREAIRRLENDHLKISVERIWCDPIEGLKARNLKLEPRDADSAGTVIAKEVLLGINWLNLLSGGGQWLDALTLRGGSITVRLPPEFDPGGKSRDFTVSNVSASVTSSWDMFNLERLSAQWMGGTIAGKGVLVSSGKHEKPKGSVLDGWLVMQSSLQHSPPWAHELYQHLAEVRTREPIRLDFDFSHHDRAPELTRIGIRIEGGSAELHGLHVDGVVLDARIERDVLSIPRIELKAEQRLCKIDGTLNLTNRMIELHALNELPPAYWCQLLPTAWLAGLARRPLEFGGKLHTEIWLPASSWDELGNRWNGVMSWDRARYDEIEFHEGRLAIARDHDVFTVTNLSAQASRAGMTGPLSGNAQINLASGEINSRVAATLDSHLFDPWIPPHTRHFFEGVRFLHGAPRFDGGFRANTGSNFLLMIGGLARCSNTVFYGGSLQTLQTFIDYSNDVLALAPLTVARSNAAIFGRLDLDLNTGVYAFDFRSAKDFETAAASPEKFPRPFLDPSLGRAGEVNARVTAVLNPHLLDPWIPPVTRHFLERIQFPADAPSFTGGFRASTTASNDLLMIKGMLGGSNVLYNGIDLCTIQAGLDYSNDMLSLAPFAFTRTNGAVEGRLDLDLKREVYAFDLHSTTDPGSIGHMVSPTLERALGVGRYGGPLRVHAVGTWDDRNAVNTDVSADVDADRIGLRWFTADHATFTLRNRGRRYEATNIVARAYDGDIAARFFLFEAANASAHDRFEADVTTPKVDLKQLALAIHPERKDPPSGDLKLQVQIAGDLGDETFGTIKGEGSLSVTNGELHKIAIFGGLSTFLSKLIPDLGMAQFTGLAMTFDIRNGKLTTSDAQLTGDWLNIKARGTYNLADDKVDFLLEVQLLKKGTIIGDTIRFITTPISKLFQLELKGTFAKPEWKTANLPKIF